MKQDDFDIPEVFRRAMEEAGWREQEEGGGGGRRPPRRTFPPPNRSPGLNRLILLSILILLFLFSLGSIAGFYTDFLWFDHLGFRDMFVKRLTVRVVVFAATFVIALAVLLGNWLLARRRALREATPQQGLLRAGGIRALIIGVGLVLAFLFASAAASQWEELLLLQNAQGFGLAEPIFGRDVGFYIFQLPVYEFFQGWLVTLLFVAALGLLPIYAGSNLLEMQRGAWSPLQGNNLRRHLAALLGVLVLVWAAGYALDVYRLLFSNRGVAYGASYVDLRTGLWGLRLQAVFALLTALALFYNLVRPNLRLPIISAALWLASGVIVGGLLPGLLQRYVVEPNELSLETPYIENNIAFTRAAFGLDRIESIPFGTVEDLSPEDLLENEDVLRNVRLWDYRPLQQTYQQLQGLRPYYAIGEIDIDRYQIDGEQRQVMLAARELDKTRLPAPSWVNRNLEFTHGYGIIMNPVNEVTSEGQPNFFIKDLPPQSRVPSIEVTRPEIYFGELTTDTIYVGSAREEFSYPSGDENVYTNYEGTGGIVLDSFLKRLAFAMRQSDPNVLLSNDITETTRVQYRRQIQERVRELTPFLLLDSDPYLVVNDAGRLVWLQDAYTVSDDYPYSTPARLTPRPSVTETLPAGTTLPLTNRAFNYMRNSVKVTIDAYDGNVTYYVSDPDDPILASYARAFPGVFQPLDKMPADLQAHLRYPVDLFWAQARQYLTYHMNDVRVFYNKEDLWQIPSEVVQNATQETEPYYVTLPLPDESEPEYLLILPFSPANKNNMIAWMAVRNDPGHYGELIVYEMGRQTLVFGPLQVEGRIDQEPSISQQFTLWDQRGSSVVRGNLLVLPINQSFLYVEPVYLLSEANALPELRRIVTASNTGVAMGETLDRSLIALAQADRDGIIVVDEPPPDGSAEPTPPAASATPATGAASATGATPSANPTTLEELVAAANAHLQAAEEAQRNGDWARYGQELELLRENLAQLDALTGQ
jgi:uncharacterized membrane protein (UPF0182 family)